MGVDTKAIIRRNVTQKEIIDRLQELGKVTVSPSSMSDLSLITLAPSDAKDTRCLYVFTGNVAMGDYKIDGTLISLHCDGQAIAIMRHLLAKFGGYLDENDCDDVDMAFVEPDAPFVPKGITPYDAFIDKVIVQYGLSRLDEVLKTCDEYSALIN